MYRKAALQSLTVVSIFLVLFQAPYLAMAHCCNATVVLSLLTYLASSGCGLNVVWWVLAGYQCTRLLEHSTMFTISKPFKTLRQKMLVEQEQKTRGQGDA